MTLPIALWKPQPASRAVVDGSGNYYDGLIVGSSNPTLAADTNFGTVANFGGANGVQTPAYSALGLTSAMSGFCWIKSPGSGAYQAMLARTNDVYYNYLFRFSTANKVQLYWTSGGGDNQYQSSETISSLGLADGNWHCLSFAKTWGSAGILVYADTTPLTMTVINGSGSNTPDNLTTMPNTVGCEPNGTGGFDQFLTAYLGWAGLYDVALSGSALAALATLPTPGGGGSFTPGINKSRHIRGARS